MKTRLQAKSGFWQTGGFRGLWRGVSAPALAGIPASGVFWAVYAPMKEKMLRATGSHTQSEFISSPISETISLLVRVPSEVLKQRIQAQIREGSLLDLVRH